ncbi:nucleotidyltransferase family protein [Phenylobacterium soli]|uniref:Nucleotidyltransferase family protein n=1 Tax=Phenylobacterium soli TaxID=2170551 RepID=A0A328AAX4_9CAUL|nr:nucleotidyltransferase family protein [Phenylobacterium soli]RAK51735.1 hypothetical protein DJ017_18055 [Phenylobacterium soli]
MNRLAALQALSALMRGAPPADCDWMEILRLANEALLTPQLHAAVEDAGRLDALPAEVRTFTTEVFTRNRERNRRLFAQLAEAVAVLNAAGVQPGLLKGAALWAASGCPESFDRMMNDLDLLVRPEEAPRAVEALEAAGFAAAKRHEGPRVHVVAELGRPQDVGFLDLHQRPPGPPGLAEAPAIEARLRPLRWQGLSLRTPDPALQVFFLVLHDQFHDGDYWSGAFSLRHLVDIAALSRAPEGVDWQGLEALARTGLARHALAAQLAAAEAIADADVPPTIRRRLWPRLQHARRMAQFRWPMAAGPLGAAAVISEAPWILAHRAADRRDQARLFGAPARASWADRLERLRQVLGGFADGKV